MATEPTYRPVLTLSNIQEILHHLPRTCEAFKKLQLFAFKVNIRINEPNNIPVPRVTVRSQLRNDFRDELSGTDNDEAERKIDYRIVRQEAYIKWKDNPLLCSEHELELVETYRFENGLLSADENAAINARMMAGMQGTGE